jgi:uncharacterized protein (DUF1778 family)
VDLSFRVLSYRIKILSPSGVILTPDGCASPTSEEALVCPFRSVLAAPPSSEKRMLAAAAAYERLDLTSFVMRSALPVAEEIVARHERITLSARDSARVLNLLQHPPKPTAALRTAARRRRKRR